jgi:FkbM family methyltransferase
MLRQVARGISHRLAVHETVGPWIAQRANAFVLEQQGFSYEPSSNGELELIRRTVATWNAERPFVFFDVGANVGDWSDAVLSALDGDTEGHLFEPTNSTFEILQARHGLNERVRLSAMALSSVAGTTVLREYGSGKRGGINSIGVRPPSHNLPHVEREVRTETGDRYCGELDIQRINLLKIDVEGWDFHVLRGFEEMLRSRRIDVIQFEYGYSTGEAGSLMRDFYAFLTEFGYVVGPLRRRGVDFRQFQQVDNNFMSGPNFVACLPTFANELSIRT